MVKEEATYSRRGAKIQQDFALLQEAILFVQLNQLECSTGTVTFFFCKLVPLVKTAFAVLFLDRHDAEETPNHTDESQAFCQTLEQSRNFVGKLRDKAITWR